MTHCHVMNSVHVDTTSAGEIVSQQALGAFDVWSSFHIVQKRHGPVLSLQRAQSDAGIVRCRRFADAEVLFRLTHRTVHALGRVPKHVG